MPKETIKTTPGGGGHGAGMVAGVKAGGFIYFSAIRGGAGRVFPDDTKEQTRNAFNSLKEMLEANGASLSDIVHVTLYLHDLKYRTPFHEVWMEVFPENPPARIAFQVADANTQPGGGAHFVLDVVAYKP